MKFNIEVDGTPEEVRRLIGLPDLTDVHEAYLTQMKEMMTKGMTADSVESMMRSWMPGGAASMDFMRDFVAGLTPSAKRD